MRAATRARALLTFAVTAASTTSLVEPSPSGWRVVEDAFERNSAFHRSKSRSSTRALHSPISWTPRGDDQCALTSIKSTHSPK